MSTTRTYRLARDLLRITAALPERIQLLSRKYGLDVETINELAGYDETKSKKYLEWLVRQLLTSRKNNDYTFYRSLESLKRSLNVFNYIKMSPKRLEEYGINPDIHRYNYQDLMDIASSFERDEGGKRQILEDGSNVIYDQGGIRIVEIGGSGVDLDKAAEAACVYSEFTGLCTKDKGIAKSYIMNSPLYIIFKNGKYFAQYHSSSNQLRNRFNETVNPRDPNNRGVLGALLSTGVIDSMTTYFWKKIWGE